MIKTGLAVLALIALAGGLAWVRAAREEPMREDAMGREKDAALRRRLTPLQYRVTRQNGTEPPFRNEYWDHHEEGLYVDVVSGEALFSSKDKFDSGTGWPSFTRPVSPESVATHSDTSLWLERTEVRSKQGDSHLGHVFTDGPAPTGLRYCINSAALRFVPAARLAAEGYGQYAPLFGAAPAAAARTRKATFAAGCFWGVEARFRKIPGVVRATVGYTGGTTEDPTYEKVCSGATGHAEAVEVEFDPKRVAYAALLDAFWKMHNPTTRDRQGLDFGSQYRSAIFYHGAEQATEARASMERLGASPRYAGKIVTQLAPAGPFYPAEEYHQNYYGKKGGGSCPVF